MNHYKTLGVSSTASDEEIKKAYRKAVIIHHPDKGGAPALFQQVQEAWEVLQDPAKRKEYDLAESKKPVETLQDSMETLVEEFFDSCRSSN